MESQRFEVGGEVFYWTSCESRVGEEDGSWSPITLLWIGRSPTGGGVAQAFPPNSALTEDNARALVLRCRAQSVTIT